MSNASITLKDIENSEIEFSISNLYPEIVTIHLGEKELKIKKDELKLAFRFILEDKEV